MVNDICPYSHHYCANPVCELHSLELEDNSATGMAHPRALVERVRANFAVYLCKVCYGDYTVVPLKEDYPPQLELVRVACNY